MMPRQMINTFLYNTFTAFFCRVNPVSSVEKPKCIRNTKAAAIRIQRLSTLNMAVLLMSACVTYSGAVAAGGSVSCP